MKRKLWRAMEATSLLALGTVGGLAACSDNSDPAAAENAGEGASPASRSAPATIAAVNEGEGVEDASVTATDDIAYLTQIGLMRGHLWVGHQLYLGGFQGMSATHMKHPKAELYASLEGAFRTRGMQGFARPLETLAQRVEAQAPEAEVEAAYADLKAAITANEAGANTASAKIAAEVIVGLLRTAAEEYAIGVIDGKIDNLHEYQDALGFTQIAGEWARHTAFSENALSVAAAARIQRLLTDLLPMWPSLDPKEDLSTSAAQLYGAAARVEIEALSL